MAIGFLVGATQITPDKSLSRASTPRVLTASFGDGYEQRIVDGINNINETFSISFQNRSKAEIDDITAFFVSKGGVTSFDYTIPDSNVSPSYETTVKVVCDSWNTVYVQTDCYTCTANFRRVYEA